MIEKHILPGELRDIFRQIGIDLADGPESEGGSFFLSEIELALKNGGITSDFFGQNYPHITDDLMTHIAILFLYDVVKSKLLINIEMPRYKREPDGYLQPLTTLEHLENLTKIFKLSEKANILNIDI